MIISSLSWRKVNKSVAQKYDVIAENPKCSTPMMFKFNSVVHHDLPPLPSSTVSHQTPQQPFTMSSRTNFLSIPPKRTVPLPELPSKIRAYISEHFRDTHPDAFARDIEELVKLRRWSEGKDGPEVHKEVVVGLLRSVRTIGGREGDVELM
jgi:hypothetical protein